MLPDSHLDLLNAPGIATLTTIGPDGRPQSTAVWYLLHDGKVQVSVTNVRQKYRNLADRPVATLFIIDPQNPFRTLEIRADVTLTADVDGRAAAAFGTKYNTDISGFSEPGSTRYTVTLTPAKVVVSG